jgi:hypothetical protein
MAEQEFEGIQRQLASLRRENRFLKVGLIFCLVLSALPYLTRFQPETETTRASKVVTERVEFVKNGRTTMSIAAYPEVGGLVIEDKNGLPIVEILGVEDSRGMAFMDKRGKLCVGIGLLPNGGKINVHNGNGKLVASMAATEDGDGTMGVCNRNGKPLAVIGADGEGDGEIDVHNRNGQVVASMGVGENGDGVVSVCNRNGKPSAVMGVNKNGDGVVGVLNRNGKLVTAIAADENGNGAIGAHNRNGETVTVVGATLLCGRIELRTPSGRIVWSAP